MDVYEILDHVKAYTNQKFKIGFVGDGEAFLDFDKLRSYITKSDSGISGPKLAEAHIMLGRMLGRHMEIDPVNTTVVAVLRGGIFFSMGIYLETGCRFETYDPKCQCFVRPNTRDVVLVDAVINTGETIRRIRTPDMKIACCVINEHAVGLFESQIYTVRVSSNSFVGAGVRQQSGYVGPDTTMRLFNQI